MKMPWTNLHGAPKVVAICVTVLLVAAGLCGAEGLMFNATHAIPDEIFIVTGVIELIAMLASVVVGFIALLVWGFGSLF